MLIKASVGQAQTKTQGVNEFFIFGLTALGSLGASVLFARCDWYILNVSILISLVFIIAILLLKNKVWR